MAGGDTASARARTRARYYFLAFAVSFLLFTANVLVGKSQIAFHWRSPILLNDVTEYLTLLVSALFFTLATLLLERAADEAGSPETRNDNHEGRTR